MIDHSAALAGVLRALAASIHPDPDGLAVIRARTDKSAAPVAPGTAGTHTHERTATS